MNRIDYRRKKENKLEICLEIYDNRAATLQSSSTYVLLDSLDSQLLKEQGNKKAKLRNIKIMSLRAFFFIGDITVYVCIYIPNSYGKPRLCLKFKTLLPYRDGRKDFRIHSTDLDIWVRS